MILVNEEIVDSVAVNRIALDLGFIQIYWYSIFIFLGIFNAFCARTERINILSDILKNKLFLFLFIFISIMQIVIIYYGGSIFGTFGLKVKDLVFIIALSSTTVIINTIRKIIIKKDFNLQ